MRDRIPTQVLENGAIRYAVYDASGAFLRYEYMLPADEPTEPGTPLNKANLLSDATAQTIGLEQTDPTVDNAFSRVGGANGVTTGINTAYVLAGPSFQLTDGALIRFRLHVDSGATPTINVNGTGEKALMATAEKPMKAGTKAGTWVTAVYSSALGFFVLQGSGSSSGATGLAHGKTFESISGTGMARINIAKMKGWV